MDVKKTSSVGCPTALCERSFRKVKYHIREALFAPRGRWGVGGRASPSSVTSLQGKTEQGTFSPPANSRRRRAVKMPGVAFLVRSPSRTGGLIGRLRPITASKAGPLGVCMGGG